jgi:hypothetical protein
MKDSDLNVIVGLRKGDKTWKTSILPSQNVKHCLRSYYYILSHNKIER